MDASLTVPLIGAHTSAAGGPHNALMEGKKVGANTIQLFTSNQKRWKGRLFSQKEIELFERAKEKTDIFVTMSHSSYLINLGASNLEVLEKGKQAFKEEIKRCHCLNINYLNFHPGFYTTGSLEGCLEQIVASLLSLEPCIAEGNTLLLLETTAGQGTCVGSKFEEIAYILEKTSKKIPIGVCIDTCHIFAAGYDIREEISWQKTIEQFDKVIGLSYLQAFHVNDSAKPFGSKKDRHASLGEGEIGWDCFKFIMTFPPFAALPKYLETPNQEKWSEEIALLKGFIQKGS